MDDGREICFCINGEDLYADKVLVTGIYDVPIFFLCKSDVHHYIALCISEEKEDNGRYIVTCISEEDIVNLVNGEIPMRDVILKQPEYYEISIKEDVFKDLVAKHKISEIDAGMLPQEGACYQNFDA